MARLNKVIVQLIIADFFFNSGWGLISPIFAIFITKQIEGGTIGVVAFATAIHWIVKSSIQPFLANALDTTKGEKDDFRFLVIGTYIVALIPFGYFFAMQVWHIFMLELLRGVAMACVIPAWFGIFTRHINKGWEAFSWSIQSTTFGFSVGFAAAFGGVIASLMGFDMVFITVGIMKLLSATMLLLVYNKIFPGDKIFSFSRKQVGAVFFPMCFLTAQTWKGLSPGWSVGTLSFSTSLETLYSSRPMVP